MLKELKRIIAEEPAAQEYPFIAVPNFNIPCCKPILIYYASFPIALAISAKGTYRLHNSNP